MRLITIRYRQISHQQHHFKLISNFLYHQRLFYGQFCMFQGYQNTIEEKDFISLGRDANQDKVTLRKNTKNFMKITILVTFRRLENITL